MTDVKRSFCIFAASTYWLKWLERRDIERLHIIWRVFVCISWLMASKPQLGKSCIKSPLWTQNNTTGINMIWKYDFLSIPFWERGTRKSFLFSLFQKCIKSPNVNNKKFRCCWKFVKPSDEFVDHTFARSEILEPHYGRDGQGRVGQGGTVAWLPNPGWNCTLLVTMAWYVSSGSMSILVSIVL